MNIIRVKLPGRVSRFKPFTVSQYRDIILTRKEMESCPSEKQQILDEMLEELFPEYTKLEREYIFINVYFSSLGSATFPASFVCPHCGNKLNVVLRLNQPPLEFPSMKIDNITFKFKMPEEFGEPDDLFFDNIVSIDDGENEYNWEDIPEHHDQLVSMITFEDFEMLSAQFQSIKFERKFACCEEHTIKFTRLVDLIGVLINPNDLITFYRTNRVLVRSDYSLQDIMQMFPLERSIALTIVEEELKEQNKGRNKGT